MEKCPYYHSNLEKRRTLKIYKNKICPNALKNKEWNSEIDKINCENGAHCEKFHTRNELFYDERNFRKIYPCLEYNKKNGFCKKFDMCPKKHATDMKLDEIYLPSDYKSDLQRELTRLKEKEKNFRKKLEKIKKIECRLCLNYIDGDDNRKFIYFNDCNHKICSSCYKKCQICPFCDLKSEQKITEINLELNEEENEENENSENSSSSDENISSKKEEGEDSDIKDDDCDELIKVNDTQSLYVSYSSKKENEFENKHDSNNDDDKEENNENNDEDDGSGIQLSSSYSNSDSMGNIRVRGRGRGGIRGRGGRINIRSRGNKFRGRGGRGNY